MTRLTRALSRTATFGSDGVGTTGSFKEGIMLLRRLLPACVLAMVAIAGWQTPAQAADSTKQIFAVLSGTSCGAGQAPVAAHFTLTGLNVGPIPVSITVNTELSALNATRQSLSGGTATYSTPLDANLKPDGTFTTVNASWNGRFFLDNLSCDTAPAPDVAVSSSHCGVAPSTLTVAVTNNTGTGTRYSVDAGSMPGQSVFVLGHQTESVAFVNPASGTYTISVRGNDGTQAMLTTTVARCDVPAAHSAAPTTATVSPAPSATPSTGTSDSPLASDPALATTGAAPLAVDPQANTASAATGTSSPGVLLISLGAALVLAGVGVLWWVIRHRHE